MTIRILLISGRREPPYRSKEPDWKSVGWDAFTGANLFDSVLARLIPPHLSSYDNSPYRNPNRILSDREVHCLEIVEKAELDRLASELQNFSSSNDELVNDKAPKVLLSLVPHKLPEIGTPNSVGKQYNDKGELHRERFYGPDGRAQKDIDYTDHGFPDQHPYVPHQHDWNWKSPRSHGEDKPLNKEKEENESENFSIDPNLIKNAAEVGATVGAGYIVYRGVRFLISLIPPLWGTIPANVAIP